jgi:2-keto-3-deoxy-6-phosphogluconate aldolase
MTLTVRLDPALESALERYCAEHGVTKSLAVQQSLATYLAQAPSKHRRVSGKGGAVSAAYRAFEDAGLIGAVALGGASATKELVRQRVMERLKRKAAPARAPRRAG